MSTRRSSDLYKHTILELTQEKKDLNKLIEEKDAKIKKILIQLEQANTDTQSAGKKIAELEKKLNKKQAIKRVIDEKITEILENTSEIDEKKDDESVDN
jgi:chromosome segregation ATPase